jgi:sulfate transport system ATP-binding protein
VWDFPANAFVFEFLGAANRFDGGDRARIVQAGRKVVVATDETVDSSALAYVRPRDFDVASDGDGIPARLDSARIQGTYAVLKSSLADGSTVTAEIEAATFRELGIAVGETIHLRPRKVHVFARNESEAGQWLGPGSNI